MASSLRRSGREPKRIKTDGPPPGPYDGRWEMNFQDFVAIEEGRDFGDARRRQIGNWKNDQRRKKREGTLSHDRERKLVDAGFEFAGKRAVSAPKPTRSAPKPTRAMLKSRIEADEERLHQMAFESSGIGNTLASYILSDDSYWHITLTGPEHLERTGQRTNEAYLTPENQLGLEAKVRNNLSLTDSNHKDAFVTDKIVLALRLAVKRYSIELLMTKPFFIYKIDVRNLLKLNLHMPKGGESTSKGMKNVWKTPKKERIEEAIEVILGPSGMLSNPDTTITLIRSDYDMDGEISVDLKDEHPSSPPTLPGHQNFSSDPEAIDGLLEEIQDDLLNVVKRAPRGIDRGSFRAYVGERGSSASGDVATVRAWEGHLESFFDSTDSDFHATRHDEIYKWLKNNSLVGGKCASCCSKVDSRKYAVRSWIALDDEDLVHVEGKVSRDTATHAVRTASSVGLTLEDVKDGLEMVERQIREFHSVSS
ncbi:hypothetical protein ACHAWF_007566 [Thalassiosira exigua]